MNSITKAFILLMTRKRMIPVSERSLRQCLNLIESVSDAMVYGYHAYNYRRRGSLYLCAESGTVHSGKYFDDAPRGS